VRSYATCWIFPELEGNIGEGLYILLGLEHIQEQHEALAAVGGEAPRPVDVIDGNAPDFIEDLMWLPVIEEARAAGALVA
jgi:hypothetical protein